MYELKNDPFYEIIAKYPNLVTDYCLMKNDTPYNGEKSHREAVLFAMKTFAGTGNNNEQIWQYNINKAAAKQINAKALFSLPDKICDNHICYHSCRSNICSEQCKDLQYWFAFLEPPHGNDYTVDDFQTINNILLPKGTDNITAYEWTTDWSDYFDDGHEWWGSACWSIYDKKSDRYIVIMASATD